MNSKVIFITGGQRSGKSRFAERLTLDLSGNPVYLATALVADDEMQQRVAIHQQRRGENWETVEAPYSFDTNLSNRTILLDCLTMFASNHFFKENEEMTSTIDRVKTELDKLFSLDNAEIVIVSNEIGLGGVSPNRMQRLFCDVQGTLNQYVASIANEVYMIVSGLPLKLK